MNIAKMGFGRTTYCDCKQLREAFTSANYITNREFLHAVYLDIWFIST